MTHDSNPAERERIAQAIVEADETFGFEIKLVKFDENGGTYRLTVDGVESMHACHGDACDEMNRVRNLRRADAIRALSSPSVGVPEGWRPMNDPYWTELAREVHRQANGPSAWATLTDVGRQYFADRIYRAHTDAAQRLSATPPALVVDRGEEDQGVSDV